ncbi:MAG: Unknown protein [uncultured Sulfurovum sp.]|uniref:Uncharacterized protein n=1 Tax=uncultured Sulfurovum sp. TaxID=269237 RepID=A0A6S6TDL0_9BACT|nr:MAG: Unknown protein [uncultured Sulfurovum sp.]
MSLSCFDKRSIEREHERSLSQILTKINERTFFTQFKIRTKVL